MASRPPNFGLREVASRYLLLSFAWHPYSGFRAFSGQSEPRVDCRRIILGRRQSLGFWMLAMGEWAGNDVSRAATVCADKRAEVRSNAAAYHYTESGSLESNPAEGSSGHRGPAWALPLWDRRDGCVLAGHSAGCGSAGCGSAGSEAACFLLPRIIQVCSWSK